MYQYQEFGIVITELREYGALVVYAPSQDKGDTTTVYALDQRGIPGQVYYAFVNEYPKDDDSKVFAAVFPRMPAGNYVMYRLGHASLAEKRFKFIVFVGSVAEVTY